MSGSIPISRKHGLRPVIATCPRCHKKTNDIVLVGDGKVFTCRQCKQMMLAYHRPSECSSCGSKSLVRTPYDEELPVLGSLCDDCTKEAAEHAEVVRQGGVYWRCVDCGRHGAIKPSDFAELVREKCKIATPNPCGVEFTKTGNPSCPVCGAKENIDG